MVGWTILVFLGFLSLASCGGLERVTVAQGELEGLALTSRKGRTYYGYLGVPYGKVEKRFSDPVKAVSWNGVKEVKTPPPLCFQFQLLAGKPMGEEDCLVLNVYSPKPKKGEKFPVLFWASPGGFQFGGASFFEAKYVMDQDVVFVSINFRMGALGFLNTGDGTVGGNMGLKDQVMALEWIKENIAEFGGDPNSVTVMGLSAGGASVDYLTISPMAKGLFHRAIAQSGTSLNPWAFQPNPVKYADILVEATGCSGKSEWNEKVKCLREKTAEEIVMGQLKAMKYGFDIDFLHMKFIPSVEANNYKGKKFLPEAPYRLLENGNINKVPFLAGFAETEGTFFTPHLFAKPDSIARLNKEWDDMAPYLLYFEDLLPSGQYNQVSRKILDFYLKGKPIGEEQRRNFDHIYSDRFFGNGIHKGISLRAKNGLTVYPYFLQYHGDHSFNQILMQEKTNYGTTHADDLIYMFNQTYGSPEVKLGTKDGDFSEKLWDLFVAFAKTGKPIVWGSEKHWPSVSQSDAASKRIKYYKIDLEKTDLLVDPFAFRRDFWDSLPIVEHEADSKKDRVKSEL